MLIYHITQKHSWQKALQKGVYVPELFEREGFIHCSTAEQLPAVIEKFFKSSRELLLLTINPINLPVSVIFENLEGNSELFPHIYSELPLSAVIRVNVISRSDNGELTLPSSIKMPK